MQLFIAWSCKLPHLPLQARDGPGSLEVPMSKRVCVLAHWEAHDYLTAEKRESRSCIAESSSDAVQLLLGRTKKEIEEEPPVKGKIRRVEYVTDYRLDCRNHKHIGLDEAREMVAGSGAYKRPVAKWVGPDERRITALRQQSAAVHGPSVRLGFDASGNTIANKGIPETGEQRRARNDRREVPAIMSVVAENGTTDWIEQIAQRLRSPVKSSFGGGAGNSGGHRGIPCESSIRILG